MSFRTKASSFIRKTGAYIEGLSERAPKLQTKYVAKEVPKETVIPAETPINPATGQPKIRGRVTVKSTPLSDRPNPQPTKLHEKVQDPLSHLKSKEKPPIPSLKTPLEPRTAPPKLFVKPATEKIAPQDMKAKMFGTNVQPTPFRGQVAAIPGAPTMRMTSPFDASNRHSYGDPLYRPANSLPVWIAGIAVAAVGLMCLMWSNNKAKRKQLIERKLAMASPRMSVPGVSGALMSGEHKK